MHFIRFNHIYFLSTLHYYENLRYLTRAHQIYTFGEFGEVGFQNNNKIDKYYKIN